MVPRRGAFVTTLSPVGVRKIYEMKSMIESFAARSGISRMDDSCISEAESVLDQMVKEVKESNLKRIQRLNIEFPRDVIKMSKNQKLITFYKRVVIRIRRYHTLGFSAPSSWKISLKEHKYILKATKSKNSEIAERLTRRHTTRATKRVVKMLDRQYDGDVEDAQRIHGSPDDFRMKGGEQCFSMSENE